MGNDWKLFLGEEEVASIWRLCSGNHHDRWEVYGFDRDSLHGHSGKVVCFILNNIIDKMLAAGVKDHTDDEIKEMEKENMNLMWGTKELGGYLLDEERDAVILYQLKFYRTVAEKNYSATWIGDQTRYKEDFTFSDGTVVKGKDIDYFS